MTTNSQTFNPRPFGPLTANVQRFVTGFHTLVYRLSGGKLGGRIVGCPVLLLSTIGRKSGKQRTLPLLYLADDATIVLVASNGGVAKHPLWWSNLQANPQAKVQIGSRILTMTATLADDEARSRLWPRLVAMYPGYADYQKRTPREIPVVVLRP
ncbi:MAG: nitroreductase family deazaflavin-dependent oxidoreductase [Ktedonobacteraceae bacterium]